MSHKVIGQADTILVVGSRSCCVSVDLENGRVYPVTNGYVLTKFGNFDRPTADDIAQARAIALATPVLDAPGACIENERMVARIEERSLRDSGS